MPYLEGVPPLTSWMLPRGLCFLVGERGSGRTRTLKNLALEAWDEGIPFVVVTSTSWDRKIFSLTFGGDKVECSLDRFIDPFAVGFTARKVPGKPTLVLIDNLEFHLAHPGNQKTMSRVASILHAQGEKHDASILASISSGVYNTEPFYSFSLVK